MGAIKFTQSDFLTWEDYSDMDAIGSLHGRVKRLGEQLAQDMDNHFMESQNRSRNYLGVNLIRDSYSGMNSDEVPHWSCGLGLGSKDLRLYIQCEAKPLVTKLLKLRDQLEPSLAEALYQIDGVPGLSLRVEEKFHLQFGGRGINQSIWHTSASFPIELHSSREDLERVTKQVFDTLDYLHKPEVRKRKLDAAGRGNSTWGVLQLLYHWNWLEVEKLGIDITEYVKEVVCRLMPFYQALLDVYDRPAPRRSRKAKQSA